MLKIDEITNPTSCLNKAADDEPIFVLRANDPLAIAIIREWAKRAEGVHEHGKVCHASNLADDMYRWRYAKLLIQGAANAKNP
jgi:hypothetical protein